jgi:hypothetical protein
MGKYFVCTRWSGQAEPVSAARLPSTELTSSRAGSIRTEGLIAMGRVEVADHAVDALDGLGHLPAPSALFLARAFHLLGDGAHLLARLHDEL